MCGICGIIGESRHGAVVSMVKALRHRGPDDFGIHVETGAAFGMTRLAILDLSPGGHQPMLSHDGNVLIIYNGELYNFKEERTILEGRGHSFRSQSDTEVVLAMYLEYGDAFLSRMRGMFALGIYDKRPGTGRERLLLARDQFGIKPLLYHLANSRLVFASEMKAILASGLVPKNFNPDALPFLLVKGSIPQPLSAITGVTMLPPAHYLVMQNGCCNTKRYWSFGIDRVPGLRGASFQEQVAAVRQRLEESVRLQMVSDVPVGAFLSGGVDSSLMVAMMARLSDHRVKTFSVGFGPEGSAMDETDDARRTAQFVGSDHTRVEIGGSDVRDRISHIAASLDQPTVDGVNSYLVSLAVSRHVKVAISGTGGDELFAGYPWFLNVLRAARAGDRDLALRYASEYLIFDLQPALSLLSDETQRNFDADRFMHDTVRLPDELPEADPIERVSVLCLRGYTQNQLLRDIDAASMAHSLEVRVPFLDIPLLDTALSLPLAAKLNPDTDQLDPYAATYRQTGVKRALIEIGRSILPPDMDVQPKRGFGMPFATWLKGPLREVMEDTLSPTAVAGRGLFSVQGVSRVRDEFLAGRGGWPQLWIPMMTELWCRELLDQ
ncbi:asparagine synthase (glutamine-hydrolyzing) [Geomonas agri]|uniref:asparagine synthase (glutamine-hydrolyzing) n=1 Tax=Geomonas agri TaxID=2873702 RepID=UPI001CD60FDA|nr:asparagine synthase (glutamine-hydrolyzing) [Geomonas agri]